MLFLRCTVQRLRQMPHAPGGSSICAEAALHWSCCRLPGALVSVTTTPAGTRIASASWAVALRTRVTLEPGAEAESAVARSWDTETGLCAPDSCSHSCRARKMTTCWREEHRGKQGKDQPKLPAVGRWRCPARSRTQTLLRAPWGSAKPPRAPHCSPEWP